MMPIDPTRESRYGATALSVGRPTTLGLGATPTLPRILEGAEGPAWAAGILND